MNFSISCWISSFDKYQVIGIEGHCFDVDAHDSGHLGEGEGKKGKREERTRWTKTEATEKSENDVMKRGVREREKHTKKKKKKKKKKRHARVDHDSSTTFSRPRPSDYNQR